VPLRREHAIETRAANVAIPLTVERGMYKLLSFDVYGTLVNTPPANAKAFHAILRHAGAASIDSLSFYNFWQSRNIAHYAEPYRPYKAICRTSLAEAFAYFYIGGANASLIEHFFAACRDMQL